MEILLEKKQSSSDYKNRAYLLNLDISTGKEIPTIRCFNCFQHLSLYGCSINKGILVDTVVCPNCKTTHSSIRLLDKIDKDKYSVYIK